MTSSTPLSVQALRASDNASSKEVATSTPGAHQLTSLVMTILVLPGKGRPIES